MSPLEPFEPEINSATDNFQLQATGVTDVGAILTSSGTAGTWTITLQLTDYSGTLNFRVQEKT